MASRGSTGEARLARTRYLGPMNLKPRFLVLIVVAVALAGLFMRLGMWQLSRHGERVELNEVRGERALEPTVDWTGPGSVSEDTTGLTWRSVRVRGQYDRENEIVLRGRSFQGRPGIEVLTPLVVGEAAVLVVRGWLPAADGLTPDLATGWQSGQDRDIPVVVEGVLIPPATGRAGQPLSVESGGREHLAVAGVDLEVIAERLPYPILPHTIRMSGDDREAGALAQPPESAPTMGNHFSYAIQWFAFAVISLVGTGILVRKEGRK